MVAFRATIWLMWAMLVELRPTLGSRGDCPTTFGQQFGKFGATSELAKTAGGTLFGKYVEQLFGIIRVPYHIDHNRPLRGRRHHQPCAISVPRQSPT